MSDLLGGGEQLLRYFERQQCSSQWSGFLGLFFEELMRNAGEKDGSAFLRHIGRRMGQALLLGEQDTLESLEAAMNRRWEDLNWGWVSLRLLDSRLVVRHQGYPVPGLKENQNADLARTAMAAVLEGVYGTWLEKQSGERGTPLRLVDSPNPRILEFVYGRH